MRRRRPPPSPAGTEADRMTCLSHPDLLMLREAAADERKTWLQFLQVGTDIYHYDLFSPILEDEMRHHIQLLRCISLLDQVQDHCFKQKDLAMLTAIRPFPCEKSTWSARKLAAQSEETEPAPPEWNDLQQLGILTAALESKLRTINKYQTYVDQAQTRSVKDLFCSIMNEKKKHIADLTAALLAITHDSSHEE